MMAVHELGRGRLVVGVPDGRPQKVLRIDATGAPPTLIGRLLVGSYITGQDQVLLTARGGLTPHQRAEIRRVVDRLLGTTVVNESGTAVEVQNFVDPTKYALPRLLHRMVEVLRDELAICCAVLTGGATSGLERLEGLEEEVDQLYLLMARQILLSSEDPRIAHDIDVESHHYQIGYRLVAKSLEVSGDLIHGIGVDLQQNLPALRQMPSAMIHEVVVRVQRLAEVLSRTMDAFTKLSVFDANATLNRITGVLQEDAGFGQRIARSVPDQKLAVATQRMVSNVVMALEMMVIVNEVTINRSVEPETVSPSGTSVARKVRTDRVARLVPVP